ncbi:hypothetical protein CRYUN_Cryun07bG0007100 [Craigia yunnanensis]
MEVVGEVTVVGPGLTSRKVGDVVAYVGNPMGSYAEEQILSVDKVVPVPPSIDPIYGHIHPVEGYDNPVSILVHATTGGVISLLCQWTNALGAIVIGMVSTKEKAAQAKEDGCHHVIIYKRILLPVSMR